MQELHDSAKRHASSEAIQQDLPADPASQHEPQDLPADPAPQPEWVLPPIQSGQSWTEVRLLLFLATLLSCRGNQTEVAQRLGIGTRTVFDWRKAAREQGIACDDLAEVESYLRQAGGRPRHEALTMFPDGPAPNCWLAPGFDPIAMQHELEAILKGGGGHIEQSYLYLDPQSAADWLSFTGQASYAAAAYHAAPLDLLAQQVRKITGDVGLDLIALGCGSAEQEVLIAQLVAQGDLRLYLLDISQPLLAVAYMHAAETLADQRGVSVTAIQGNFFHLPRYTQLHYTPQRAHRRRIITMLGGTFGNLDNEISTVRDVLVGFAPGDLLVLHVCLAPTGKAEDPRPPEWQKRFDQFLTGPLRRHGITGEVKITTERNGSCPVPGSYSLRFVATTDESPPREFTLTTLRRYDVARLAEALAPLGWQHLHTLPFHAQDLTYPQVLVLFRRGEVSR